MRTDLTNEQILHVQQDLPAFPPEIINEWLGPYVQSEGWPPNSERHEVSTDRWRYLLGMRPVSYWASFTWQRTKIIPTIEDLGQASNQTLAQLITGYVQGKPNIYTQQIPDGKQRFQSVLSYLSIHKSFPGFPVLAVQADGLEVLDGNHRMAAYFTLVASGKAPFPVPVWLGQAT
ncbi:hypothetical protein [Thiobacillus sp. 0-1251]|uniref:hypothetical protein n=1 Tax=Thiobacillus sp. 0-1251 TaxID=1895858 RepID=UPI0025CFF009|nr:hypothetical protein [Thiobacillus sp. 0-1251]